MMENRCDIRPPIKIIVDPKVMSSDLLTLSDSSHTKPRLSGFRDGAFQFGYLGEYTCINESQHNSQLWEFHLMSTATAS